MKNRRRMEIMVETREITIIRAAQSRRAFCEFCQAEVLMLAPDTAAALVQSTSRYIFRRIERGELHFSETGRGALLICRNSLERDFQ